VFDYTMDNEDNALDLAKDLYAAAKELDPKRPVNTADGVWGSPSGATAPLANPQDFRSVGFELFKIPLGTVLVFGQDFEHGFCRVRVSPVGVWLLQCSFLDRIWNSRMPTVFHDVV
jgi:hypothetical protein